MSAGKNKKGADLIYSRKQAGNINKWNQKQAELKQPEEPAAPAAMSKSSANSTPLRNPANPVQHRSVQSAQKTHVLTTVLLVSLYLAATANGVSRNDEHQRRGRATDRAEGSGRIRARRSHLVHLLAVSTAIQGCG
jgi:hypothetical protein